VRQKFQELRSDEERSAIKAGKEGGSRSYVMPEYGHGQYPQYWVFSQHGFFNKEATVVLAYFAPASAAALSNDHRAARRSGTFG
jgi:hypothetical protein